MCFCCGSARIIEHTGDFLGKGGNDRGVEERIETGKDDTTDDYADDDLHARVDIALTCGGLYGCLDGCKCLAQLVLDGIEKLMLTSFLAFKVRQRCIEAGKITLAEKIIFANSVEIGERHKRASPVLILAGKINLITA